MHPSLPAMLAKVRILNFVHLKGNKPIVRGVICEMKMIATSTVSNDTDEKRSSITKLISYHTLIIPQG